MQLWGCNITWIIVNVGESSSHATPYSWLNVCFKLPSIKFTNSRSSCPMDILPKNKIKIDLQVFKLCIYKIKNKNETLQNKIKYLFKDDIVESEINR